MNNLICEQSKSSPFISFDAETGLCELTGSSYPENASEFYLPLIDWLNKYMIEIMGPLHLKMRLDYLNSSSIKFVSDLIDKADRYARLGIETEISWHYESDDEDSKELGEEFKKDTDCKFNLIAEEV